MSKTTLVQPHSSNPCAGAYPGHLDVMFTPKCNARCKWCIEKHGWHPAERISAAKLAAATVALNPTQVNILGGEPTQEGAELVQYIKQLRRFSDCKIAVTSNVSAPGWLEDCGADYINLSLHHYDLEEDRRIKRIQVGALYPDTLNDLIKTIGRDKIRFNCTVHKDGLHTRAGVLRYLQWAVRLGIKHIRFAELQCCGQDEGYLSLRDLMGDHVPADPFTEGCCTTIEQDGVTIQFRTSCGIVCPAKSLPSGGEYSQPGGTLGVLYYDGSHFPTRQKAGKDMNQHEIIRLLQLVKDGDVTVTGAAKILASKPNRGPTLEEEILGIQQVAPSENCHGSGCHGRRGGC